MILPVHRHLLTPIFLRGMDKSVKQRTLLLSLLVLMVALVVIMGAFFSSLFSSGQNTGDLPTPPALAAATPTDTPTPTATPMPVPTTPTPPPLVNASSAYLLDATSGRVLLNVPGHLPSPPRTTTKLPTALPPLHPSHPP